jgi:hypothetical protein
VASPSVGAPAADVVLQPFEAHSSSGSRADSALALIPASLVPRLRARLGIAFAGHGYAAPATFTIRPLQDSGATSGRPRHARS